MKWKSLVLIGWFLLPLLALAQFSYTTNNEGGITVTGCADANSVMVIPSTIDGLPVTSVGDSAFFRCDSLTAVSFPDTLTNIGKSAFFWCGNLTALTIPHSVTTIGASAFAKTGVGILRLPECITTLGSGAFSTCTNLTEVTFGNKLTAIADNAFANCSSLLSVTIPDSVTNIGMSAFMNCVNLTNASIGNGVVVIELWAFDGCHSLANVTLGNNVSVLGTDSFGGARNLTSITIPDSVSEIRDVAFYYCTRLTNVFIGKHLSYIGAETFSGCTNLTGVYFAGNAPSNKNESAFLNDNNATVYYLPGTTGWGASFIGRPTAQWFLPNPLILTTSPSFGIQTNRFGFMISWATNAAVVVEASTNLADSAWYPVQTNYLTGGTNFFSDPQWTNYPNRLYRLRWP